MTDFEPFDDDLAIALQRRAPAIATAELDTAGAHGAVLARARGIRRRRAGIAGGATLAAVIAGGILLLNGNADDTLAPASEPSTSLGPETSALPPTSAAPMTSLGPQTTRVTMPAASIAPTTPATTIPETALATMPASTGEGQSAGAIGGRSAGSDSSSSSSSSSTSSSSSSSSSTSSTVAAQGPAPFTKTYPSSGGSITVSWNGSSLSLDSVNPTTGYTAEIEDNAAARIRVRFRGPTADSRIEVRFENGQVTERVD